MATLIAMASCTATAYAGSMDNIRGTVDQSCIGVNQGGTCGTTPTIELGPDWINLMTVCSSDPDFCCGLCIGASSWNPDESIFHAIEWATPSFMDGPYY